MIDLKDHPEAGWNLLLGISLLVCVASAGFLFYRPPGDSSIARSQMDVTRTAMRVHQTNEDSLRNGEEIHKSQWKEGSATIGSAVLSAVAKVADSCHVQLSGFRSDKLVGSSLVQEVPFVGVVTGTFPDVMSFVGKVESPASKLALNMLQVTTTDSKAGTITATLGIVAFLPTEAKAQ